MDIAERALAQVFAQETILTALVMTHPDPARFADTLEQLFAHGQLEWAQHGLVAPDAKQAARALFEQIRDIARMEAEMRSRPNGS